jgi:catechol 2,3-dioxygenase-like lactoylglutathione lyase family enzyme
MTVRVDHVGLVVGDVDACVAYLEQVFDALAIRDVELEGRVKAVHVTCGGATFELMQRLDDDAARAWNASSSGGSGLTGVPIASHVSFVVPDIDAEIERLASLGVVPAGKEGVSGGKRTFFVQSPAAGGLILQVTQA